MAMLTGLAIALFITPKAIRMLRALYPSGQPIRQDGPKSHLESKKSTPTCGGLIIIFALLISSLLWVNLSNPYIWITLFVTLSLGLLGFTDDYMKLSRNNPRGVSGKLKLVIQALVSVIACFAVQKFSPLEHVSSVNIPFFKNLAIDLGYLYVVFVGIVIIGSSNAVNLTDGLDGLATMPVILVALSFAIICYLVGNHVFSEYLYINYVPGAGELTVLCGALIGASLGFLWYNAHPAQIFMGDVGSLSLGGTLGVMSVIVKHEFVLAITGGLFVMEALSVILQVYYFKFSGGNRIFLMAPLHHHFEKKGWTEQQVVIRFWIIAAVFMMLGLSTLKLR
jgi:phospho-N-acetylmuramoyl-pentapeptide-transferase